MRPHLYAYAGEMHPTYAGEVTPHARYTTPKKCSVFVRVFLCSTSGDAPYLMAKSVRFFISPVYQGWKCSVFRRIASLPPLKPHRATPSPPLKITHSTPVSNIFFKFVNGTFHRGDRLTPVHLCRSKIVPTVDNSQIYFMMLFHLLWYQSDPLKTEQTGVTSVNFGSFAQALPLLNRVFHSPHFSP